MKTNRAYRMPSVDEDSSRQEKPERVLQRAVLSRAIYDLTPEANFKDRRSALNWFNPPPKKVKTLDHNPFSFERIKEELCLGAKALRLIEETIEEAIAFQDYHYKCKKLRIRIDIQRWVASRESYRRLNQKRGIPSVAFRRRKVEETCDSLELIRA